MMTDSSGYGGSDGGGDGTSSSSEVGGVDLSTTVGAVGTVTVGPTTTTTTTTATSATTPTSPSSTRNNEQRPVAVIAKPYDKEFYTRDDMILFNALEHPVYVFDILNKCMWWANTSAVEMWNSESLEALLERDFVTDMSDASEQRMLGYLRRFQRGERVRESW